MFLNLNKIKEEKLKTDILIIGCGTTAIYIAEKLKQSNKKIIIVEKGNLHNYQKKKITKRNENYLDHNGFKKNISIGVGGNSTLWGGQLVEFERQDFTKCFWGFDYSEAKKLYKKVFDFFGVKKIKENDFLNFTNQKKLKKKNIQSFYTQWLQQPNFKKLFFNNLKDNNHQIFLNTEISNFKFNKKTCEYVEIRSKKNLKKIYPKAIVLCAGTFGNIEIMLQHKAKSPWKNNKFIGKYFQDHIGLFIGKLKIKNKKIFDDLFLNGFITKDKYQPKIKSQYNLKNFNYGISGEIKTSDKKDNANEILKDFFYNIKFTKIFDLIKITKYLKINLVKKIFYFIIHKKILFSNYSDLTFYVQCEQKPNILSKVFFNQSKKKKKLSLNWNISGEEISIIKRFVKDVNLYFETNNICQIDCKKFDKMNLNTFKKKIRDTNHPSGGLIISKNKDKGVVDKNLKVWNTSNIFVNGSVTFPCSSHANITLTSLALSERLASYLKKKY